MCPRPTWSILQEPKYQAKNVVIAVLPTNSLNPLNAWVIDFHAWILHRYSLIHAWCGCWSFSVAMRTWRRFQPEVWFWCNAMPACNTRRSVSQVALVVLLSSHVRYMVTMMIDSFCGWACGESFFLMYVDVPEENQAQPRLSGNSRKSRYYLLIP